MADNHPRTPRNLPAHGEVTATQTSLAIPPQELPTATRTIRRTVTFSWPFMLSGIASIQPAGTYTVETDEELVQEISFPVFRRTATLMLLPALPAGPVLAQIATIDPLELEVALERDAMKGVP
jgi:hypothetical protein